VGKAKMMKIREVSTFPFVFENKSFLEPSLTNYLDEEVVLKGVWSREVFKRNAPITVELACGKGDYTLALAKKFPERNFIGVDIKGDRLWRAGKSVEEMGLSNVAFLRTKIELLELFFEVGEIDELWITFPDPFPKKGDAKRRLTASGFLAMYKRLLHPGSTVHFKTDAIDLFDFSEETIKENGFVLNRVERDIYGKGIADEITSIKTYYEKMHIADGRTINYLNFTI
jgi:tRNA (guanine-N7-)-methyltransferase